MLRVDLPGWAVEERSAIDGSTKHVPIVFMIVIAGMTPQGIAQSFLAYVEESGTLTPKANPKIVRVDDA